MDFSRADSRLIASNGNATSTSFLFFKQPPREQTAPEPTPRHIHGQGQGPKVCWAGASASRACCKMLFQETINEL